MSKHTFNNTLRLIQERKKKAAPYNRKKLVIREAWVQIPPPVFCRGQDHSQAHYAISERRIALLWKDVRGTCNEVTCVSSPLTLAVLYSRVSSVVLTQQQNWIANFSTSIYNFKPHTLMPHSPCFFKTLTTYYKRQSESALQTDAAHLNILYFKQTHTHTHRKLFTTHLTTLRHKPSLA